MGNELDTPQPGEPGDTEGLLSGSTMTDQPRMSSRPVDSGVGVPPYRPAPSSGQSPGQPKEAPIMGRTPFPVPNPAASGSGSNGSAPTLISPARPGMQPGGQVMMQPGRVREAAERRTLVVGRGISVQGTVADAERLVVEGTVEASMIHATELAITQGGVFKGEVEVEDAEIAGVIDGTLTARGNLVVRATGKVLGTARCRRLQVEDGGQITGRIEMLNEGAPKAEAARPAELLS